MRHRLSRLRLRQKPAHSRSMQRNIVTSLLLYETVRTTKKRAEVIRPLVDRIIRTAQTRPAHVAIRSINRVVFDKNACRKTMEVLKDRFAGRTSGFTRLEALGSRRGDGAQLVNLMLIEGAAAVAKGKDTVEKNQKNQKKEKKSSDSSASSVSSTSSSRA